MRRLTYASLALAAIFCCLVKAHAAGPEVPRLEIHETTFDFKEAFEGEKVSHDFMVKNPGKGILEIKEVRGQDRGGNQRGPEIDLPGKNAPTTH